MKRLACLLFLVPLLVFSSCDKDDTRIETWTIASGKGVAGVWFGLGYVPAYVVKTGPNAAWEVFSDPIQGFTFEEGTECVLRVRIDPVANPPADASSESYTMELLVSRTPAESAVDWDRLSPRFELVIGSELGYAQDDTPCYWSKDARYSDPRWMPFPCRIEGFDFIPGRESRLLVKASARYDDIQMRYTVQYALDETLASEEKDSEGLPGL